MKRLVTYLLAVALLAGATAASAQITFRLGLRGGLNRALTTVDGASNFDGINSSYSADKSAVYAWQTGAVLEVNFGKVALQPALVFMQKGEKLHTSYTSGDYALYHTETTGTNRYNWLEVPLNVVYTLQGDHGLQIFAGPYVALAVGGRQQGTLNNSSPLIYTAPQAFDNKISYGPDTNNRRLDAGVNFGVGYRQGPLQVQLGYGLGLRNLHQSDGTQLYDYGHNFNADAAYNRVAQLTGTYFSAL